MTQKIAYQVDTPKVKYLMCKRGITEITLARSWKCHPSTVCRVIHGQIKDQQWLNKLAQALEVDVKELLMEIEPISVPRQTKKGRLPGS